MPSFTVMETAGTPSPDTLLITVPLIVWLCAKAAEKKKKEQRNKTAKTIFLLISIELWLAIFFKAI
jgi:hypothetical protein